MQRQTWIIGSSADCDIVVDSSTVSGRHCRLSVEGDALTLEDLDSTNGTFVNGEPLTGTRTVTTTDTITLGQHESLPWPESIRPSGTSTPTQPARAATRVITIGRGPDNDVVLDESNVSTQHARLTVSENEILLEDLGSTNGTSVGSVENKIHRATVRPDDKVYFGSASWRVSRLLARAGSSTDSSQRPSGIPGGQRTLIAGIAGTVVVALLVWAALPNGKNHEDADEDPPAVAGTDESQSGSTPDAAQETVGDSDELSDEERLARSLFAVVGHFDQVPMRIGTAFAIDAQHVATTVDVARSIQEVQQSGERAWLFSPETGAEITITETRLHPEYDRAVAGARRAQGDYNRLYDTLKADFDQREPSQEELESARERLLAATMNAQEATENIASFLVAVLTVESPLEHWLPTNPSATAVRPNLRLSVMGLPPDPGDHFLDPDQPIEPQVMESRVRELLPSGIASRMLVEGASAQHKYDFQGSPVMNDRGEVVAVYSRVTPPPPYVEEPAESDTFDAPLIARVSECLVN